MRTQENKGRAKPALSSRTQPGSRITASRNACAARAATGLSQSLFAKRFGIAIGTLRDWEQGRKQPEGPARSLLKVIEADPNLVQRALGSQSENFDQPQRSDSSPLDIYTEQWRAERGEDDLVDFQFRAIVTLIARTIEYEFRTLCRSRLGVGEGDMRILLTLRRNRQPLRQASLIHSLLVTSGGVTKQVQRLEKRGLIRRTQESDGMKIALTEKGHRIVSEALSQQYFSTATFRRLPKRERMNGLLFLRQILAGIAERQSSRNRAPRNTPTNALR